MEKHHRVGGGAVHTASQTICCEPSHLESNENIISLSFGKHIVNQYMNLSPQMTYFLEYVFHVGKL